MRQYKQYYTVYKDKDLQILPQLQQGVMNSWHILKMFVTEEVVVVYSNGWNPLSSKLQTKMIKDYHSKKREASKEEAPVASTSKPSANHPAQEGKKNKKKNVGNHIPEATGFQKSKKDAMDNVFNMARTLMEFMDKEEERMRQSHFPRK
ncbi:hypothetical protein O181_108709 [Austropuccinia psidii MF-1]|uniref:Uncharacterized protein n=1 Tax=Austropuccinia psidii MF-1 TaxID=1389203 RepID=A0A9Q3JV96_9BASI|nr:hypothetical protein [Austropuccinia psidii MF-1]